MINSLFRKKTINGILKDADAQYHSSGALAKTLGVRDLAAFGIAAIIGAGIFSTIGKASSDGGPAVIYLFIFTAIACSFAAFAYAEFASIVPVAGSAYTYSYVAFGELIAWIIGWSLIMEYAVGNITVAISWSDYFTSLLASGGIDLPAWMTMDYLSASRGFNESTLLMQSGKLFENLSAAQQSAFMAWKSAPLLGNFHFVADLPALLIIVFITWLVYRGMKESRNASNLMVVIKLAIILLIIAVGVFYVDTKNWTPFAPNGFSGVIKGVSAVFFAYIGFDAISTTAEECKNPQRDLPRGMMWAIIICTILYVAVALILTGMVKYDTLAVGDPLAFVFQQLNLTWLSGIIAVSAVVAMASVLLVFQLGQPRIWMSMSRDGLLPKAFSRIHPTYRTPSFATIVTGFVVAIPSLFMNLTMVTDLCSIGTLFAFVLVCAGVLKLQQSKEPIDRKFKTPYLNSKYIIPLLLIASIAFLLTKQQEATKQFVFNEKVAYSPTDFITSLNEQELTELKSQLNATINSNSVLESDPEQILLAMDEKTYVQTLESLNIAADKKFESGWKLFKHKIPTWIFFMVCIYIAVLCFRLSLSFIPVAGLLCCLYMMSEMGISNWIGFGIWLIVGLIIYFAYGYNHSKLKNVSVQ